MSSDVSLPSHIMVGYVDGATNDYDPKYDGEKYGSSVSSLYSVLEDKKLSIQGKAAFSLTDEVPLGFIAESAGTYTISLEDIQGLDNVFIKDNGITNNLPYTFTTEAGEFNDRLVLVYGSQLSVNEVEQPKVTVFPNPATDYINICGAFDNYTLYDVLGKLIKSGNSRVIDLRGLASGVYVLRVDKQVMKIVKK